MTKKYEIEIPNKVFLIGTEIGDAINTYRPHENCIFKKIIIEYEDKLPTVRQGFFQMIEEVKNSKEFITLGKVIQSYPDIDIPIAMCINRIGKYYPYGAWYGDLFYSCDTFEELKKKVTYIINTHGILGLPNAVGAYEV